GYLGPFNPVDVTEKYIDLCRSYKIYRAEGDRYSAEWVRAAWQRDAKPRLSYRPIDETASVLYLEALPLFTRGLVELPDHPTLLRELRLLERIPGRTGKDSVTHPRGCHDDYANAACGVLRLLARYGGYDISNFVDDDEEPPLRPTCPPGFQSLEDYEKF